ncbi:hypothetical protein EV356DRAFT_499921 [Viridothelium virens]|uniref:Phosphoglycerate mutase-like protein n=1 Tax=Viridothelium virens TaxID=1048519 RepID=A0A6A6HNX9_VIRVR|nr:hypothetical protein EV356DRAFT_499921 [Viridothelium virens]
MPPKTIHLIRHAQGYHNLTTANHALPDPLLTPFGESQCRTLSTHFPFPAPSSPTTTPSLLLAASPLKRTLSTALLVFSPLLASHPTLRILALPEAQETSDLPCDTGSTHAELLQEFANQPVDLSLVAAAGDSWNRKVGKWSPHAEAVAQRAREVREWVWDRGEEVVALVTHGGFLHYLTEDWSGANKFQGTGWANTEFRTFTFASESPSPSYSIVESSASRRRRSGSEKPLTEAEQRNLKRSAEVQSEKNKKDSKKDDTKKGLFAFSKLRASASARDFVGGY